MHQDKQKDMPCPKLSTQANAGSGCSELNAKEGTSGQAHRGHEQWPHVSPDAMRSICIGPNQFSSPWSSEGSCTGAS